MELILCNDIKFDWDLINGAYEQRKLHPWNYEGNPSWLRENLVERFDAEKAQVIRNVLARNARKGSMMSLWVFKVLCYLKRHKILIGGLILIILAIVGLSIYNSYQVEKPVLLKQDK